MQLAAAPAAYWCRFPEQAHVRWVLPQDEEIALAALARLRGRRRAHARGETKFAGMFRAHGLLVPVWDLPGGRGARAGRSPCATSPSGTRRRSPWPASWTAERRARQGLLSRQLTLR